MISPVLQTYPLVNVYITMEKYPFYSWVNPLFLWAMASIAMLNYQRVTWNLYVFFGGIPPFWTPPYVVGEIPELDDEKVYRTTP